MHCGKLYLVATPLGNLEDITLRALKVLAEVDCIAAEDTRHTLKLLNHFQIRKKKLISFFQHNERKRACELVQELLSGQNIALVSDAGMPGISDPGNILVREAIANGIQVIPIPGATALITALAASGLNSDSFRFEGFLPRKVEEQKDKLKEMAEYHGTLVFYESPHRLVDTLKNMLQVLGDRQVVIARELTKIHEEFIRGNLEGILSKLASMENLKGEFTILLEGRKGAEKAKTGLEVEPIDITALFSEFDSMKPDLSQPTTLRSTLRLIARKTGMKTKDVYDLYMKSRPKKDSENKNPG